MQVPQPGGGGSSSSGASGHRRHVNESDYEEIGPPPNNLSLQTSRGLGVDGGGLTSSISSSQVMVTTAASTQNSKNDTNPNNATAICDLCGTATAIVKCGACA